MKVNDARKFSEEIQRSFNVGAGIGATPTWGYCVFTYIDDIKGKRFQLNPKFYISKQSFISHNAGSTIRALFFDQCKKKAPQTRGEKIRRERR